MPQLPFAPDDKEVKMGYRELQDSTESLGGRSPRKEVSVRVAAPLHTNQQKKNGCAVSSGSCSLVIVRMGMEAQLLQQSKVAESVVRL